MVVIIVPFSASWEGDGGDEQSEQRLVSTHLALDYSLTLECVGD
jgi:hypothetical protein